MVHDAVWGNPKGDLNHFWKVIRAAFWGDPGVIWGDPLCFLGDPRIFLPQPLSWHYRFLYIRCHAAATTPSLYNIKRQK